MHRSMTLFSAFVFAWQLWGAGRTFTLPSGERPSIRHQLVPLSFMLVLALGFSGPVRTAFLFPGALGLAAALVLFEWARRSIRGHYFSFVFSRDVPGFLWQGGPFRHVRNPFYSSYLLSAASVALLFDSPRALVPLALLVFSAGAAARHEERKFLASPLRAEYEIYAVRTGRFIPHVGRLRPQQRSKE